MRYFLGILILLGFLYVCSKLYSRYETIRKESKLDQQSQSVDASPQTLPGMPATLEPLLQAAKQRGSTGLAEFLRQYRYAISDPRLADIELDYVVLVSLHDAGEARRVFKTVQQRTDKSSPLYQRVKRLEKNYQ
jgi:hypothetical protein